MVAVLLTSATQASACVPAPGWPKMVHLSAQAAATRMVRASFTVDLVKVESLSSDFQFGTKSRSKWISWVGQAPDHFHDVDEVLAAMRTSWAGAARIHFRVLRSLKDQGSVTFDLSGESIANDKATRLPRGKVRLDQLKYFLDQQDLAAWESVGSCQKEVFAAIGQSYLVFRNKDGSLLREPIRVRFKGRNMWIPGPAYIPVDGLDDPWVRAVRYEIEHH